MKELDRTKVYDLRDLSDKQKGELLHWLIRNDKFWDLLSIADIKNYKIHYSEPIKEWDLFFNESLEGREVISALELFEEEPQLQIGQTFEYNGFICEVKEKVEEKKWYLVIVHNVLNYKYLSSDGINRYINKNYTTKLITDQEFINQLEKYSR